MKVIYTAGPYRADGGNGVFENIMLARLVARRLWLRGWAVICPHLNAFFMDGPDTTFELFMTGDKEILGRCDAILMLPGYKNSEGAMIELQLAKDLEMPVYYNVCEVPDESKSAKCA